MTPEQARQLLEGTTPAPWEHSNPDGITEISASGEAIATDANPKDAPLIAAAPDMANMIAGMSPEYAVQGKVPSSDEWLTLSQWSEELPPSEFEFEITLTDEDTGETHRIDARIAARYVTAPQPLGEEQ